MNQPSTASVASLPPRLTLEDAVPALARLKQSLAGRTDSAVALDAGPLEVCDTSAVAVLLELQRGLQRQGRSLKVLNQPQRLRDLVKLYGMGELLPA